MIPTTVEHKSRRNNGVTWRTVTWTFVALGPVYMIGRWIVSAAWGV
jgi:hypothetical protein